MIKRAEIYFLGILFVLFFGLIITVTANASDVSSLEAQIQIAEKERNELEREKQEISSLDIQIREMENGQVAAKARLIQKNAQLNVQIKEYQKEDEGIRKSVADTEKDIGNYNAKAAIHNANILAHNQQCDVVSNDESFIKSCGEAANILNNTTQEFRISGVDMKRRKDRVNAEVQKSNALAVRLNKETSALKNEEVLLLQFDVSIEKQRENLSLRTLEWSGKMKKINALLNRLYAAHEETKECLRRNQTPEGQKHCSNIPFDGADSNLPKFSPNPGDKNVKPPFTMTPR